MGFTRLLNYVGGAIIYVKSHYAERVTCLLRSWKQANHGEDETENVTGASASGEVQTHEEAEHKKKGKWSSMIGNSTTAAKEGETALSSGGAKDESGNGNIGMQSIPTTYKDGIRCWFT